MPKVIVKCDNCDIEFLKAQCEINKCLKRGYLRHYCSGKCRNVYRYSKLEPVLFIKVECFQCKIQFTKRLADIRTRQKRNKNLFCSYKCRYKHTKSFGVHRSQMEIFIEQQIRQFYPEVRLICNNREILNGLELDFYFPELKFGIELNGPTHYEPIYGYDRFTKIINNDKQKMIRCNDIGIELAVIDITHFKYFTEKSKNFYWNIVNKLLQKIIPE